MVGGAGCVGGRNRVNNAVFPGRRFRHQHRPVDDRSLGRREMTQDGGTRGGTFHDELDRRRESQRAGSPALVS